MNPKLFELNSPESVLFLSIDSCRFDTFYSCHKNGNIPNLSSIGPLHIAKSPSYFTYGSHAAFWMGFTPGVVGSSSEWLNPKVGKLFRMEFSGHSDSGLDGFFLNGSSIIDGFKNLGYRCIGTGAVDWFNPDYETGVVLGSPFDKFYFAGNTWNLKSQLSWLSDEISSVPKGQPIFVFINIGETHVPYWHEGANWDRWPSPCVPFGDENSSSIESSKRQQACLQWVDFQLGNLIDSFSNSTILACADHGDCWGEDGLWEHGISHEATLTVPLLLRVRGTPIHETNPVTNPNRIRNVLERLKKWIKVFL